MGTALRPFSSEEDWCLKHGKPVRTLSQNRLGIVGVMWCDGERGVVDLV